MQAQPSRSNYVTLPERAQECGQPPTPAPFDRLRSRAQLLDAYAALVDDFAACLELAADLDPQDAEAALCTRLTTYLDAMADALGSTLPRARRAA